MTVYIYKMPGNNFRCSSCLAWLMADGVFAHANEHIDNDKTIRESCNAAGGTILTFSSKDEESEVEESV